VSLERRVLAWFQIYEKTNLMSAWLDISTALQMHFGPSQFENHCKELLKLKQNS